ncbi:hypothetical protein E4U43_001812 [Claviceps pusilla]|uniref:GTP-binding protein OBG n=1 Tax=Claviceps pusilla TaxID=123648 RepID=A0A9P7NG56_9HYPO|nr:hypothetical protein E4U43_001812 [Claviceps pusilla]
MPLLRSVACRPRISRVAIAVITAHPPCRFSSSNPSLNDLPESRLNPAPDDYALSNFADKTDLTLYAGRGGNGCVSFLREAFLPDGPPNGGDGGAGGNIYIQAAHGETSLHKLARRRFIRAGRGKHGQGSAKGGARGEDVVITVPVGTIVRELERQDPAAEEAMSIRAYMALQKQKRKDRMLLEDEKRRNPVVEGQEDGGDFMDRKGRQKLAPQEQDDDTELELDDPSRHKWLLYPGMSKSDMRSTSFPRLPRRHPLLHQPPSPIYLDLSRPTPRPILLAAGGIGGLGNPHFTSREHPKPIFATKGEEAVSIKISLELKLLADVGLVGLPNAGKSTLLRALTNSRTRVGSWAFTTLQPNIGTVVLDKYSGQATMIRRNRKTNPETPTNAAHNISSETHVDPRTRFTVADIPGLIEGAHLDRGLGIAFLRHVERAGVLAFVIDLSAGNAVTALNALWREVGLYAQMRDEEERDREIESRIEWDSASAANDTFNRGGPINLTNGAEYASPAPYAADDSQSGLHIAGKPWFVVATKGDLPDTEANFYELKTYLDDITTGKVKHPSGVDGAWIQKCMAIPVSAIHGQGVDRIVHWTVGLLDE